MRISVFGLGYVGAVTLACLGRDGHDVIGVDIDETKLQLIRNGQSPIIEHGIVELMQEVVNSGRIAVTNSARQAIEDSELSFVCVGTPSLPNGNQDLKAIVRLSQQIGEALKSKRNPHTIVVRSTVQPGTVENTILPLLEEHSGSKVGERFHLCFQPEFLREGSSISDYDHPPMTVVGSADSNATEKLNELFGDLPCDFVVTDIKTAETLKYACNAFHAAKITFANEIGRIGQALGADSRRVMQILCEDRQLNISPAYLRPGFAFGGSCLPKDLRALLYMARSEDVDAPMLSALLPSNRVQVDHALEFVLRHGGRNIAVIGLSFKSGTDDLRESPMVTLVEQMIGKGLSLRVFDPEVQVSRLLGANKKYIDETIPHIGDLLVDSIEDAMRTAEVVIVGLNDHEISDAVAELSTDRQLVLDLVGIERTDSIASEYQGICW